MPLSKGHDGVPTGNTAMCYLSFLLADRSASFVLADRRGNMVLVYNRRSRCVARIGECLIGLRGPGLPPASRRYLSSTKPAL